LKVLLVKMSSLGDVVHALPGVTDAARHGVRFDWVVEEDFADIPALHPAVEEVIPIAWRRWRTSAWRSRSEMRTFLSLLRARHYDLILDTQGLIKSGVVARFARGAIRAGYDGQSARESMATCFYNRRFNVPTGTHAVVRQRELFATALGYLANGIPEFGLEVPSERVEDQVVLAHGTTWESKEWPEPMWIELAQSMRSEGLRPVLPWGDDEEYARAERIALRSRAEILPRTNVGGLVKLLAGAGAVIGVDSGLTHLAGALGTPTVVVYGATDARLTGARGAGVRNLSSTLECAPCLRRTCSHGGAALIRNGAPVTPACFASVAPERVWQTLQELMNAPRILHL
jgi:heptosyltransferase-1|tara:strand:- start:1226 stop:2257 length:1032 start_codon:yes stop_codon:yes gene_type:complete